MIKQDNPKITNPEKILFPESKIKKSEIVEYYSKISEKMLPHIKDRYLALQRFPNGINKQSFFQKNTPIYYPPSFKIKKQKNTNYSICENKECLIYLGNQASIEIHSWSSRSDKPDYPDKMIFDLDPSDKKDLEYITKAAFAIKKILENFNLVPFVMLTGSRGLHIIVPINPKNTFNEVRSFALKIAQTIVDLNPDKYTLEQRKDKRKGKIYIDINRNSPSQLAIAPYSVRPKENAPIASPISWSELKESKNFDPQKYNINNIFKRKGNPWKNYFQSSRDLPHNKQLDEFIKI